MEEFAAAEEKWLRIAVPNTQEIENINDHVCWISERTTELVGMQPKCWLLGANYDNEFSGYKSKVEEVKNRSARVLKVIDYSIHSASRLARVQEDLDALQEEKAKKWEFWDEWQKHQSDEVIMMLKLKRLGFEQLSNVKLEEPEKRKKQLEKLNLILEQLVRPTHEWTPMEWQYIPIKPAVNPHEGSSMEPRKAKMAKFVSKSRCAKCFQERMENEMVNW